MDPSTKLTLFLIVFRIAYASAIENNFEHCERVVKNWASSSLHEGVNKDKHTLQDLLFFLHVPRTGGRSYYHCFLKKLYPSSQECPRSYDKLRFDPSKPNCRLLATHDDYSMMHKLPKEKTSVVTIVRNPVDRVLSSYEFSVEVAARFLVHPDLKSATKMSLSLRVKTNGVSTLDIWPWKYLVPWMRGDLFARRDARRQKDSNEIKRNSPYAMEDIVMPLHEYINDPVANEIVHNGATFQIAGLTNNSYVSESHEIRHCVQKHKSLGEHVLHVAKKRLDDMLYVGLTAEHRESATMFANVVGAQVISQLRDANFSMGNIADNQSGNNSLHLDTELENNDDQSGSSDEKATVHKDVEPRKENMTVKELIKVYEGCISSLLKTQSRRRFASLKRISPANFSKEARRHVPEVILEQIKALNYLDMELFKYAQKIFSKRHEQLMGNLAVNERMGNQSDRPPARTESKSDRPPARTESKPDHPWARIKGKSDYPLAVKIWKIVSAGMIVIVLLALFIFLNARRRISKVKV